MRKIILSIIGITILLISSQFVLAQAPGFMGKKTAIYYSYAASPSIVGLVIPYNYSKKKEKGIANYIRGYHQATFEYSVARNLSLNAHYFMSRGGYGSRDYNGIELSEHQNPVFSRNYKSRSIGISLKKYRVRLNGYRTDDGGIAPIGRYFEPKFFVTFVTDENRRTDDDTVISSKQKMHYGGSITWGRHVIIGKNIILNFGMEMGYVHPNRDTNNPSDYYESFGTATADVLDIGRSPYEQIVKHHLLAFHVGIGYPLF